VKLRNPARYAVERCGSIKHVVEVPTGTPDVMLVIGRNQHEVSYSYHSHGSPCGTLEEGHAFTGDKKETDCVDTFLGDRRAALI